jgi:CDGSH-type Zn-finger protein/uncharacterized Fe-S cluster protein YjdI
MTDRSKNRFQYTGEQIDVEWDARLCIHIGECGRADGDLFQAGRKPWCDPNLSSTDHVAEVVERCPTGALFYKSKDENQREKPPAENKVTVSYNGPYFFTGELAINGVGEDMPGVAYRAALCRCGASANKPFCDNSHEKAEFKDYAAVGQSGSINSDEGGELKITPLDDGPLMVKGNLTVISGSGRRAWQGSKLALCRCGASRNKPFCDGAHVKAGFKSS